MESAFQILQPPLSERVAISAPESSSDTGSTFLALKETIRFVLPLVIACVLVFFGASKFMKKDPLKSSGDHGGGLTLLILFLLMIYVVFVHDYRTDDDKRYNH